MTDETDSCKTRVAEAASKNPLVDENTITITSVEMKISGEQAVAAAPHHTAKQGSFARGEGDGKGRNSSGTGVGQGQHAEIGLMGPSIGLSVGNFNNYMPSFQQNGRLFQNFAPSLDMRDTIAGLNQNGFSSFAARRYKVRKGQWQGPARNHVSYPLPSSSGFQQPRQLLRPGLNSSDFRRQTIMSPLLTVPSKNHYDDAVKAPFHPICNRQRLFGVNMHASGNFMEGNNSTGQVGNIHSLQQYCSDVIRRAGNATLNGGVGSLTVGGGDFGRNYFSRKVFVGGLPPDIDEDEIKDSFSRFGPLIVDWPHKARSKSYFPPKGYAFLLFQKESSVQQLVDACVQDNDMLFLLVSSPTITNKPVQIRPWRLSDADFVLDDCMTLDPRKTVFIGGVPRPLKAVELATILDKLYGGVCYAGISTDPQLKYPKGAARVVFSNEHSYLAAVSVRFVQLQHRNGIDKRVEIKPYVLNDQMCDECGGRHCGGKYASFFCANVTCLQYYCQHCWAVIHCQPGREYHKPLVKEGSDSPRTLTFPYAHYCSQSCFPFYFPFPFTPI